MGFVNFTLCGAKQDVNHQINRFSKITQNNINNLGN